jgi:hypothetical protein
MICDEGHCLPFAMVICFCSFASQSIFQGKESYQDTWRVVQFFGLSARPSLQAL